MLSLLDDENISDMTSWRDPGGDDSTDVRCWILAAEEASEIH